jgi:hypothetical protein
MVISPVVDEIILLAVKKEMDPLLLELTTLKHSISAPGSSFTGHAIPIRTAFAQAETKEFNISKFIQEMERIHLTGNDLMALENFCDSILRAFNTICTSYQLYPFYKDLKKYFDFKTSLCHDTRLTPTELLQAKINYCSSGAYICLYLLSPSTITKASCPKAFIKFLSLKGCQDSLRMLHDLVFQLSPQLESIFYDFGTVIAALKIFYGEHLIEFYSRAQHLAMEIKLANLPDGNNSALCARFLTLL